ncbi:restriction endonuclease subunit S [Pseudomonas sp. CBMAI 2609]|uniref:Restriction endonuclease subunit S n=1 Tax=Pseudomonas flavocrustae TaxID=2991719 RepID=A0ABT6IHQ3_9PSED|nr:restriction endonuclease subunit S [Pseudomonas sp. CBMAI 2609]MDH4763986.1 restriction endonuclease subunit S [Pseudomonas sp. CBMAI 2609]
MSWPISRLSEVISFIRGVTFTPEDQVEPFSEGSTVVMRTKNIQVAGLDQSNLIAVPSGFVRRKEQELREGDILVSSANSWELVGKASYVPKLTYEATAGGFISIVRAKESRVDSRYLYHWVACPATQHKIRHCGRQTTNISNLDVGRFQDLEIPLPPLPEQKRIAAILDKADAIRRKRQQAIQLADDFLRAVFLDIFGDPVTNPKGWPLKRFGEVGTWSSGGTPSRTVSDFFEGEINWYSAGELNSRYLDGSVEKISELAIKNSAAKIFKKGSLLVGMYDTAAMKISILKEDSSCNQACANVECNELASVEWLYSYIDYAKDSYLSRRRGVRQKNLNLGMIRDFLLPLPPRDLQDEFVRFVSAVFGMKKKQDEYKDFPVFESLSLKAFSGQL